MSIFNFYGICGIKRMVFNSNRNGMFKNRFSYLKIGTIFLIICSFSWTQDPEPPEEFEFNISIYQSFYFFLESDIEFFYG